MSQLNEFGTTAKSLARNPLGIIALFIVLVYGFASLVVAFGSGLQPGDRTPLVWFLVVFPGLVLVTFAWLVSKHHLKLYAPSDYREESLFLQASQVKLEVAAALGAAAARRPDSDSPSDEFAAHAQAAASVVERAVTTRALTWARQRSVLWVDDRPSNNVFERQALERLGVQFVLATSTEQALARLRDQRFDVIISDMGRPPDQRAGYTLLEAVRQIDPTIPFIIYAGSRSPEHHAEALRRGAQDTTNRPDELFEMVVEALRTSVAS